MARDKMTLAVLLTAVLATTPGGAQMIEARVTQWYGGKQAAVSLRFDDAHPTHLDKAVPLLNEFGFPGTFMVNPGRPTYQERRTEWEQTLPAQGHELADHTMNHGGASTDDEAAAEIAGCADYLRALAPQGSPMLAFARGGGTTWMQRRPTEFFLKTSHLIGGMGGSMSCSEDYPSFSLDAVRSRLDRAIQNGEWFQTHYHCVDEGYIKIPSATLRAILQLLKDHADQVWVAGMKAIYKYQQERSGSHVLFYPQGEDVVAVDLTVATAPRLYDQPLTLEVRLPAGAEAVTVRDTAGQTIAVHTAATDAGAVVRFDVPPVDGIYRVEAPGLGSALSKQQAPGLGVHRDHPYLFFTEADLARLTARTQQPPTGEIWERIKSSADGILRAALPTPPSGDDPDGWNQARRSGSRVRTLSFAYAMTGEPAYLERAKPELEVMYAAGTWSDPRHRAEADLVSAEATCTLGLAYDWLHKGLSVAERDKLRSVLVTKGLEPIFKADAQKVWWSIWPRGNWGSVIFGQAGVAALALLGDEPRAAEWVRRCEQKIWLYTQAIGQEGGWGESVSYACYCWLNGVRFIDALQRVGGDNLLSTSGPRKLPAYFLHLLLPDKSGFVPFSNCGTGVNFGASFLYRLADEYDDPHAQWIAQQMQPRSSDPFAFLWIDPDLQAAPPTDLPTMKHFRTIDWAVMRNRWEDPEAVLFALKGGQKDWDHQHNDFNSFVLYAYGRPLITDLNYPHQLWGCQTEAHNTIMVNGHEQRGRVNVAGNRGDPEHQTVLGGVVDAGWYRRLVGDASAGYEPEDVSSYVREVLYLQPSLEGSPSDYFVILDDLHAPTPSRLDWMLHTYGELALQGNTITLRQDDAAADVTVLAPERFEHEVLSKNWEEAGVSQPFETARAFSFIKVRPTEPVERGRFLAVIMPRRAAEQPSTQVEAVRGDNVVGARVRHGEVEDLALFALEAPRFDVAGVQLAGRTCFLRRGPGGVVQVALQNAQKLTVDGVTLFDAGDRGAGDVVLTLDTDHGEANLRLGDVTTARLHVPRRPTAVMAGERPLEVTYDAETKLLQVPTSRGGGPLSITY